VGDRQSSGSVVRHPSCLSAAAGAFRGRAVRAAPTPNCARHQRPSLDLMRSAVGQDPANPCANCLDRLLPGWSGADSRTGWPVCVTPRRRFDRALELSPAPGDPLAPTGDCAVPGSAGSRRPAGTSVPRRQCPGRRFTLDVACHRRDHPWLRVVVLPGWASRPQRGHRLAGHQAWRSGLTTWHLLVVNVAGIPPAVEAFSGQLRKAMVCRASWPLARLCR